jgi:glycosyltransferase involved in cell wall biosynthesis
MRLAWFTPWPPQRSGIAGRSAELVPLLAGRGFGIDVFVDERRVAVRPGVADAPAAGAARVQSAHDFVWRARRGQYDLAVYQLGNSRLHEFIWPYLFRWPGLAVLHDAGLHHARGRASLSRERRDAYRAEFRFNHPDVSPDAAELAVHGFDGPYYYQWPMVRSVLEASRLTAVHSRAERDELAEAWPDAALDCVALGEGPAACPRDDERRAWRAALGLKETDVAFGVFGALTAEKRVPQIMRAFSALARRRPDARLLLGGSADPDSDLDGRIRALGLDQTARLLPPLDDDEAFDRAIAAVDVSLHLRWPTAREISGPWLRALASARPTVIVDLAHLARVPALDPRTWELQAPVPARHERPIAVAIDVLDEDHSLLRAMARLADDGELRARLGRAAREYWEAHHTVAHMVEDYVRVIARAAALRSAPPAFPAELRPDPLGSVRRLVAPFGIEATEQVARLAGGAPAGAAD